MTVFAGIRGCSWDEGRRGTAATSEMNRKWTATPIAGLRSSFTRGIRRTGGAILAGEEPRGSLALVLSRGDGVQKSAILLFEARGGVEDT
jgi:hypothetical protein